MAETITEFADRVRLERDEARSQAERLAKEVRTLVRERDQLNRVLQGTNAKAQELRSELDACAESIGRQFDENEALNEALYEALSQATAFVEARGYPTHAEVWRRVLQSRTVANPNSEIPREEVTDEDRG